MTRPEVLLTQGDRFDEFWTIYPRREKKPAARTAWVKASKRADAAAILAGAARYRDDPNREDEFTKHASTWLNNDCWGDDPLPTRGASRPTGSQAAQGWLDAGRQAKDLIRRQAELRALPGGM